MKNHSLETTESRLVMRGINLWLTDALRSAIMSKAERLFRHEPRIIRIRVDLNRDRRNGVSMFVARGRVELHGPDLLASVVSADGYKSIDWLIDRLDRMLRRRATIQLRHRTMDDLRAYRGWTASSPHVAHLRAEPLAGLAAGPV